MISSVSSISNALKKYNSNITIEENESEGSIVVSYQVSENESEPILNINGIDFVEQDTELRLWSQGFNDTNYLNHSGKYYVPFLTTTNFERETIRIVDHFFDNPEKVIGKIITKVNEEHIGKCLCLMSKYDLLADEVKMIVQQRSEEDNDFYLKDIFSDNLFFIEIDYSELGNDYVTKEEYIESLVYAIRAKMAYNGVIFHELVPYPNESMVLTNHEADCLKIDSGYNRNVDAFSFFISAKSEKNRRMKFLDFYHVIEYFFYSNNLRVMRELINEAISLERMGNIQNPEDRLKVLQRLFNRLEADSKRTAEREMFQDLLVDTVGYDSLYYELSGVNINFLNQNNQDRSKTGFDISGVQDRKSPEKSLLEPEKVAEETKEEFLKNLASRLYDIRNFIVHSAKYKADHDYVSAPRRNDNFDDDINLIEKIAYILLNKNIEI